MTPERPDPRADARIAEIRDWRDQMRGKDLGQATVQWRDSDVLLNALDAAVAARDEAEQASETATRLVRALLDGHEPGHCSACDLARVWLAAHRGSGEACDGSIECRASVHIHGCFADLGQCDRPSEHERREAAVSPQEKQQ